MARFTDRQLELLQAYVDKVVAAFDEAGLAFTVEGDLREWAETMRAAPSITAVSPSFDPDHSWLTPANSFWVCLRDGSGQVIGCICSRLFETDDMMQIIRSYRLFFDRKPVLDLRPLRLVAPDDVPIISGRIGYTGGYWLHPDWRGRGPYGISISTGSSRSGGTPRPGRASHAKNSRCRTDSPASTAIFPDGAKTGNMPSSMRIGATSCR